MIYYMYIFVFVFIIVFISCQGPIGRSAWSCTKWTQPWRRCSRRPRP